MRRNIAALAGQELDKRLSESVVGLRRGLEGTRGLHASLRAEAAELKAFIPVLIQGTVSSIQDALRQQVRPQPSALSLLDTDHCKRAPLQGYLYLEPLLEQKTVGKTGRSQELLHPRAPAPCPLLHS